LPSTLVDVATGQTAFGESAGRGPCVGSSETKDVRRDPLVRYVDSPVVHRAGQEHVEAGAVSHLLGLDRRADRQFG
jgi:hypothetical protein